MTPIQLHATMATMAVRLNNTNAEFICLIAKAPDDHIEVYFDDVPSSGPKLDRKIDQLKMAISKLQETIKNYEDKHRYNG